MKTIFVYQNNHAKMQNACLNVDDNTVKSVNILTIKIF